MQRCFWIGVFVSLMLPHGGQAGYLFTSTTKAEGGRDAEAQNVVVQALVEGPQARVEFTESRNPVLSKGNYVLTQDGGKTLLMVDPGEKTYTRWDVEAMMGAAGDMMKMLGGMMQMEISEPKVEKLADEAGPELLGLPTRHYKFRTTFTTAMTLMGRKSSTTTVKEEELWATSAVTDTGMGAWLRKSPPTSGHEQIDKMIRSEMSKIQGFPLKHIAVTTTTDAGGKVQTNKTVTEVTALKKQAVPAGVFVLPADYTELKMEIPEEAADGEKPAMSIPPALLKMMQKK